MTFSHVTPSIEANSSQVKLLQGAFLEHFLLVSSSVSDGTKSHVGTGVGKSGVEKSPKWAGVMVAGLEEGQAAEMEGGGSARAKAEPEPKLRRGSPQPNGPTALPSRLS